MKLLILIILVFSLSSCAEKKSNTTSVEIITSPAEQDSIFKELASLINDSALQTMRFDSTAFLILPVEASCPSCRKKTIDSLMKHKESLARNHFVIISATAGIKGINAYFREQDYQIPTILNKLFIDSNYRAYKLNLFDGNPAIYYAYEAKVYKKVFSMPATVREDLREFFSGQKVAHHSR